MDEVVVAADGDTSCRLAVGQPCRVVLAENPTTGFRWAVARVDGAVEVTSSDYVDTATGVGGGGFRHLVLTPRRAGDAQVGLVLKRAWNDEVARTVRLRLSVSDPSEG